MSRPRFASTSSHSKACWCNYAARCALQLVADDSSAESIAGMEAPLPRRCTAPRPRPASPPPIGRAPLQCRFCEWPSIRTPEPNSARAARTDLPAPPILTSLRSGQGNNARSPCIRSSHLCGPLDEDRPLDLRALTNTYAYCSTTKLTAHSCTALPSGLPHAEVPAPVVSAIRAGARRTPCQWLNGRRSGSASC